ncbi:MAG: VWA domain-containing protein [Armatimonadetes bacterium]|nr:VWA domain-containing protein [Armatimonadota bacterium]
MSPRRVTDGMFVVVGILLCGLLLIGVGSVGCAKRKAASRHTIGSISQEDGKEAMAPEEASAPEATAKAMPGGAMGGGPRPPMDRNAYVTNTYMGGRGARERMADLIDKGVMVNGKAVKLEAFSAEYRQPFPMPRSTALAVTAATQHGRLLTQGGRTFLQVGIQGIKREAPQRPPLNICLVIDHSGSMGDESKLEHARDAALEVVNRIAATDTIAVVAYDQSQEVLVAARKATDKDAIRAKIRALQPGGSTDIYAALQAGYGEVRKNLDPKAINEVILISDGQVTSGTSDLAAFSRLTADHFDKAIQTTTVGMGLDFDEQLMMTVAREGKGNYHFVRDALSIKDIFKEELEDLTHAVARALRLRVQLAPGVEAVRVLGSEQMSEAEVARVKQTERAVDQRVYDDLGITRDRQHIDDEPGLKVVIPQFYMGDSHVVMIEVNVPAGRERRKVADVYLKYKDLVFPQNREDHLAVTVNYTTEKQSMVASIDRSIRKNVLGFETGEALQKAATLLQSGQSAQAAKAVDEQMVVLGTAAQEWNDTDLNKDGVLLAAYRDLIAQTASPSANPELGTYLAKALTYSAYQRTR